MMVEQLWKLVEYAEPKPKSFICVSGNKLKLKTSFIPPLEFPPSSRYEMALTSMETNYSFPNIDASNNHLKVSLDDGKTWMEIHIPTGCYETKAINNELQRFIMIGYKEDEKRKVIGFNKKNYKAGRYQSENLVNILSINSILVHCDVIETSRLNRIEATLSALHCI